MFDPDRFIHDCLAAVGSGPEAIHELLAAAIGDSGGVLAALGEPVHAGLTPLYRSPELTVINFVWAPCMSLMPHNHQMFSVVGLYSGREDNIFWRRTPTGIEATRARSLGAGDTVVLDRDAIHSVLNPIGRMSCALHVYGGDFFAPPVARSQWDPETLDERPWDVERVKALFRESEARYAASVPDASP